MGVPESTRRGKDEKGITQSSKGTGERQRRQARAVLAIAGQRAAEREVDPEIGDAR